MARRREQGNYRGRSSRRNRSNDKPGGPDGAQVVVEDKTQRSPVELPAKATVGELAEILELTNVDTIKTLMRLGVMATVNETVEFGIAAKVAASFEIGVLKQSESVRIDHVLSNSIIFRSKNRDFDSFRTVLK